MATTAMLQYLQKCASALLHSLKSFFYYTYYWQMKKNLKLHLLLDKCEYSITKINLQQFIINMQYPYKN